MANRYKEAMRRNRRSSFQRRDMKTEMMVFREVELKGYCCCTVPKSRAKLYNPVEENQA